MVSFVMSITTTAIIAVPIKREVARRRRATSSRPIEAMLTAEKASGSWPRDDGLDDGCTLRASHFVISIEIAGFKETK
jgi:hypothetical protein